MSRFCKCVLLAALASLMLCGAAAAVPAEKCPSIPPPDDLVNSGKSFLLSKSNFGDIYNLRVVEADMTVEGPSAGSLEISFRFSAPVPSYNFAADKGWEKRPDSNVLYVDSARAVIFSDKAYVDIPSAYVCPGWTGSQPVPPDPSELKPIPGEDAATTNGLLIYIYNGVAKIYNKLAIRFDLLLQVIKETLTGWYDRWEIVQDEWWMWRSGDYGNGWQSFIVAWNNLSKQWYELNQSQSQMQDAMNNAGINGWTDPESASKDALDTLGGGTGAADNVQTGLDTLDKGADADDKKAVAQLASTVFAPFVAVGSLFFVAFFLVHRAGD